jgi:hypothetical protein
MVLTATRAAQTVTRMQEFKNCSESCKNSSFAARAALAVTVKEMIQQPQLI